MSKIDELIAWAKNQYWLKTTGILINEVETELIQLRSLSKEMAEVIQVQEDHIARLKALVREMSRYGPYLHDEPAYTEWQKILNRPEVWEIMEEKP